MRGLHALQRAGRVPARDRGPHRAMLPARGASSAGRGAVCRSDCRVPTCWCQIRPAAAGIRPKQRGLPQLTWLASQPLPSAHACAHACRERSAFHVSARYCPCMACALALFWRQTFFRYCPSGACRPEVCTFLGTGLPSCSCRAVRFLSLQRGSQQGTPSCARIGWQGVIWREQHGTQLDQAHPVARCQYVVLLHHQSSKIMILCDLCVVHRHFYRGLARHRCLRCVCMYVGALGA